MPKNKDLKEEIELVKAIKDNDANKTRRICEANPELIPGMRMRVDFIMLRKSIKADTLDILIKMGANELQEANLRGADLSGANLSEANLRGANLSEANLIYANLRGADLSEVNLKRANLIGANLSKANLYKARLNRVNLSYANLSSADLGRADFREANLYKANFREANLYKANLKNSNSKLNSINLDEALLFGVVSDSSIINEKMRYAKNIISSYYGFLCLSQIHNSNKSNDIDDEQKTISAKLSYYVFFCLSQIHNYNKLNDTDDEQKTTSPIISTKLPKDILQEIDKYMDVSTKHMSIEKYRGLKEYVE